jgi:intein/homing endonuclease
MSGQAPVFDDLGGEFSGKLREIVSTTRQTADGVATVTFSTAVIECDYIPNVVKKLATGQLLAIPNVQTLGAEDVFSIYEIADVFPMHYSQPNLDRSQPASIRKEFMELIEGEWKKGSKSTWIEIVAAPIGYVMRTAGGVISFERKPYAPLAGSSVRLLSSDSVEKLICYRVPKGEDPADYRFGNLLGVIDEKIPFTVDIEKLIHYHCGVFAFSLDYNEPIIYRQDGQVNITEIGKLVDPFFRGRGEEGRKYTSSVEVVSFDPKTFDVRWTPIQYMFRHRYNDKLLKFTLRTGRNVSVTPCHSLFVLRKGKIVSLPASQIIKGDFVVGTREIPDHVNSNLKVNLRDLFKGKAAESVFITDVPKSAFDRLEHGGVPSWRWCRWRQSSKLPLTYWDRLTATEQETVKLGYKGAKTTISPILEIDKDIARLLGYFAAEGNAIIEKGVQYSAVFTLSKEDKKIIYELQRILKKKFGITIRKYRHGENGVRIAFNNKIIAHFLLQSTGTGARRKIVPRLILNSPSPVRQEFIRAWAEGDYPSCSSRRLTNDLLYTLLLDRCAGAVNWIAPKPTFLEGRRIRNRGKYQFSFPRGREMKGVIRPTRRRAEPIYPASELPRSLYSLLSHPSHVKKQRSRLRGPLLSELETRLSKLMSYEGSSAKPMDEARHDGIYRTGMGTYLIRNQDTIHASPQLLQASNDMRQVKTLQQSLLGFYEVQKIDEVNPTSQFVYDVSVPSAENFLAGFGGVFCHNTGSGKSNLTSTVVRKALKVIPDLKVVILDVSSEYGIHILDVLNEYPSKVLFTDSFAGSKNKSAEYFKRHVCPEALADLQPEFERKIARLFDEGKIVFAELPLEGTEEVERFTTYGGLIEVLTNTLNDKYGAVQQKIYVPQVITQIKQFMHDEGFSADTRFNAKTAKLITQIQSLIGDLPATSSLKKSFDALAKVIEATVPEDELEKSPWETLPDEILSTENGSPRVFVINLPEAEDARAQTADVISRVFRKRKKSFSLTPKVLFIVDEAQEFIPQDARKGDNAYESSKAVERLLRHGRKYNLFCWVSTQRIAHLNTNALQQLHSYFISTMPRPYDRQLVADTFAIGDAFVDRTLAFSNGDWLITSFKATATQNIPVFFHAENNEETLRKYLSS